MAKLHFYYGAMNSGKSMDLIRAAHNYEERGMRPFLIKPETDTKGHDRVVSRIGSERKVDLIVTKEMDVEGAIQRELAKSSIDCILADEAQFLTPDQIDQLFALTVNPGLPVMAYGLRNDFKTQGFPGSTRLLEIAHVLEEIRTICKCGANATLNARLVNGEFTLEGEQLGIDGADAKIAYEALCGVCFTRDVGPISNR